MLGLAGLSINGTSFKVGDPWTISVTGGDPNTTVYFDATQSNLAMPMSGQQDLALSNLLGGFWNGNESGGVGKTDSNGNFSISGTFSSNAVGTWVVNTKYGGVEFNVVGPAYAGPTNPGSAYYQGLTNHAPSNPSQYTAATLTAMANQNSVANTGTTPSTGSTTLPVLDTLTSSTGMSTTELLLIAGGVVVALFMFGGKK